MNIAPLVRGMCAALVALTMLGCGESTADEAAAPAPAADVGAADAGGPSGTVADAAATTSQEASPSTETSATGDEVAAGGPPPGRYVCRQYTTTMGYLTLEAGGAYEVSGVRGRYRYDPQSGAVTWQGGSYDEWGWDGTYEKVTRPAGDGRPDEDIIRIASESDGLRIDCYRMNDG